MEGLHELPVYVIYYLQKLYLVTTLAYVNYKPHTLKKITLSISLPIARSATSRIVTNNNLIWF